MKPYRIIYIVGLSHSGSTLLDLLLSTHSAVTGLGELKVVSPSVAAQRVKGKAPLDKKCACLESIRLCPFWSGINAHLQRHASLDLDKLDLNHPNPTTFEQHHFALFEAAESLTGSTTFVDLSKNLPRLKRLQATGFDLRPLHIIRDPRGVVYSALKKGRPMISRCMEIRSNVKEIRSYLKNFSSLEIHYEDLVAEPDAALAQIYSWLELSAEPVQATWHKVEHHHLSGNRLRRERNGVIRLDVEWKTELLAIQKLVISLITNPGWVNQQSRIIES